MGVFVRVRGWLDCDEDHLAGARAVIAAHAHEHYSRGWVIRDHIPGYTPCVLYTGDLREHWLDWLLTQVRAIAALPARDDDHVRGLFFAMHETRGTTTWRVHAGQVSPASPPQGLAYLDE
ncbi:hypothetical protein [Actinokineospora bangkokensis]|uniref:Uncharacterized protein n=1 Tax=Actinokineospora bangkokensis TaxID=1193682 RepID=A0A1Q9LQW3_9PSEU|nr:hypothetical protein [Actinokineospora bangkokensis]OLR94381.1 hypothetical protein BJP25_11495 [Actinokineospora bangkokensis]